MSVALLMACQPVHHAAPPAPRADPVASSAPPPAPTASSLIPAPLAPLAPLAPPAPPAPPTLVLRYACDDKYDSNSECRPGQRAWDAWLEHIDLAAVTPNLLNHQGGGPSGAEWNPNGALVAFVVSPAPGRARLESRKLTLTPAGRFNDRDVFVVPIKAWAAAARPAKQGDLADETALLDAISIVELRAVNAQGTIATGTFAFSGGE